MMTLLRRALCVAMIALVAAACGSDDAAPASPATIDESAVQIVATGCRRADVHGAGLMVADGRVATVAHVVAGAKTIEVRGLHGTANATVVYFDPVFDVAVLKVDPRLGDPIPVATAKGGDVGSVVVYRQDAPVVMSAAVQRAVDIRTADIYGLGSHLRPGYELGLDVQPGDSGSVVVVDGKAVAIVWATSRQVDGRAWAMRASLVADHLTTAIEVDHGHCA